MSIKDRFFLDRSNALLLVIDIQEKLCKAMNEKVLSQVVKNSGILIETAEEMQIPVIFTEQYVKGLGPTLPELTEKSSNAACFEKMAFSCCGNQAVVEKIKSSGRKQIIIAGMETHVCVLQTVIELCDAGFAVHVVKDAIMSRHKQNWLTGFETMAAAGAIPTSTESVMFQLLKVAGTDEFKKLSKLVR